MDEPRKSVDNVNSRGRKRSEFWTVNDEPSKTHSADAPEADINEIMRQYGNVGVLQHLQNVEAQFADVSEFEDYAEVARYVAKAERQFMALHPDVREIFQNDVSTWLDTAHDQEKQDALIRGGFIPTPDDWVDPLAPPPPEVVNVEPPPVAE